MQQLKSILYIYANAIHMLFLLATAKQMNTFLQGVLTCGYQQGYDNDIYWKERILQ